MLQIVRPQSALIVVDVQNDFISGSLAVRYVQWWANLQLLGLLSYVTIYFCGN
jgi:hypothetical protein